MSVRMQHCFNCGEALGVYARYYGDSPEVCGSAECVRAARDDERARDEEAQERAREDGYDRYR